MVSFFCIRIPMRFGNFDDFEIGVQVHTVAIRTTKSAAINIDRKTNQQVKKQTNVLDANTGDILMPSDIKQLQVILLYSSLCAIIALYAHIAQ